jgi:serine/threonine-protein kinase
MDFKSRNGTFLNGQPVKMAEIKHGDRIKAGHTVFQVSVENDPIDPEKQVTFVSSQAPTRPVRTEIHREVHPEFAGYELVQELGSGAMGVVYLARRLSDGQEFALKTITAQEGADEDAIERFLREAAILKRLSHPNIIAFVDSGVENDVVYLVMERVTGPDVEKVLHEKGPLPVRTAVRIVAQMLDGLHHAHQLGYVHRDIKPSNLLLHSVEGKKQTKVADFGLAKAYQTSRMSGVTMMGDVGGTVAFMPPEQITHFKKVNPAADQYSAAATLYNLLTNQYVYDFEGNSRDAMLKISTEDPVPIQQRRDDLPDELSQIIHRALSRNPKDRFSSAAQFRKALAAFATSEQ